MDVEVVVLVESVVVDEVVAEAEAGSAQPISYPRSVADEFAVIAWLRNSWLQ